MGPAWLTAVVTTREVSAAPAPRVTPTLGQPPCLDQCRVDRGAAQFGSTELGGVAGPEHRPAGGQVLHPVSCSIDEGMAGFAASSDRCGGRPNIGTGHEDHALEVDLEVSQVIADDQGKFVQDVVESDG